jgi:hypothetical protein
LEPRRAALICVLLAHILLVWGSIGFLGETWAMLLFCMASKIDVLSWALLGLWLVSTLSPIVGIVALWRDRFWTAYLYLIALTLFVLWLNQFLLEIRVIYCDAP